MRLASVSAPFTGAARDSDTWEDEEGCGFTS